MRGGFGSLVELRAMTDHIIKMRTMLVDGLMRSVYIYIQVVVTK